MRRFLLVGAYLAASSLLSIGGNLMLLWDAPTNAPLGYQVNIGTNAPNFTTATNFTITNAVCGVTNTASVRTIGTSGLLSDPTSLTYFYPCPPSNMRSINAALEAAPDVNGPWQTLTNYPPVVIAVTDDRRFLRLKASIQ